MASTSPTVNLDLNSGTIRVGDGYTMDPPKFQKGYSSSPLRHGARPTNSSAGNRTLTIPLQILSTGAGVGAVLESISRQVMVDNILKVQFGSSTPVFFRTFGDPDYAIEVKKTQVENARITLVLEAEPDAYGVRVEATGSPFTVSNDPANAAGCFFDIASVLGDVETPLLLHVTSTGSSGVANKWSHFSTRRRGTPSGYSNVVQAESMTQGTGGVVTADAAMSGGSKSRIGFGTPANTLRLSDTFPGNGTSTVEARGEYIVYARCALTNAADVVTVQLAYGASSGTAVFNDAVTVAGVTTPYWVNLGKMPVPAWSDPVQHGFSGVSTKVVMPFVGLYAARTSGSGSLDVDALHFMPADDQTLMVRFPSTDVPYAVDGTTEAGGSAYGFTTSLDEVTTTSQPCKLVGGLGFPSLIPGQTNRVHFLRNVDPTGVTDAITNTTTIRAYYWPRWREFTRP